MEIARDFYLRELILRKHNGSVKVVTGIRRVGKSYLLFEQFTRHLKESGTDDAHIIQIALDDPEHAEYCKPITLLQHLKSLIHDENMYYILLDEVQLLDNFEGVLRAESINDLLCFVKSTKPSRCSGTVFLKKPPFL